MKPINTTLPKYIFEHHSALILPRIDKDTRIELGIYKCGVWILFLEICLVHPSAETNSFVEHFLTMEILISCLREIILIQPSRTHTHLIHDHPIVVVIGFSTVGSELITDWILGLPIVVLKAALLEIIVFRHNITRTQNLRFRTKILLLILWEIIYRSFILVQRSKILIVIWVLMIVERVHPLVSAIDSLRLVWNLHTTLIQYFVDVFRI